MHEFSLMSGVFDTIDLTLSNHKVSKVTLVRLGVGKLTNVENDAMLFAFEAFAKGTICEDAQLVIEEISVKARCRDCSKEFMIEKLLFQCEKCQSINMEIIEGEEVILESLEVE